MKKVIFTTLLFCIPNFAFGALPEYDIKAYCKTVGEMAGGSSMIELSCRDMENEALAKLQKMEIPAKTLKYCDELGQISGGSYTIFESCVEMELDAAKKLQ